MKLVEILAKGRDKLNCPIDLGFEWFSATQVSDGDVCFYLNEKGTMQAHIDLRINRADDWVDAVVTRAQWEAERARILAESSKFTEQDKEHIADLTAIACGKRSKEDQELWDRVAISVFPSVYTVGYENSSEVDLVDYAFDIADAFMEERAKRMK